MNSLSGFQIIALSGLQNGEGLSSPNIAALKSQYNAISTVENFSNIYYYSNANANITMANANLLQSLGSISFPHIFGQVPYEFSSNIGYGPLFDIAPQRITNWFGNNSMPTL